MKFKLNGKVEHLDNSCYWFLNDKIHREDGPAIEYPSGTGFWYLNGRYIGDKESDNWEELVDLTRVELVMES